MDQFIVYAMGAADAGGGGFRLAAEADEERERTGVMIGSGIGGLQSDRRGLAHCCMRRGRAGCRPSSSRRR